MGVLAALHVGHVTTHGDSLLHLEHALAALLETLLGARVAQLARNAFTFFAASAQRQKDY